MDYVPTYDDRTVRSTRRDARNQTRSEVDEMDDQTVDMRRRHDENASSGDDDQQTKPSRLKRLIGFTVGGLVVIGLIVGGTRYWLNSRNFESTRMTPSSMPTPRRWHRA